MRQPVERFQMHQAQLLNREAKMTDKNNSEISHLMVAELENITSSFENLNSVIEGMNAILEGEQAQGDKTDVRRPEELELTLSSQSGTRRRR